MNRILESQIEHGLKSEERKEKYLSIKRREWVGLKHVEKSLDRRFHTKSLPKRKFNPLYL